MTTPNPRAASFTKTSGVRRAEGATGGIKTKNPPKPAPARMPRAMPERLAAWLSADRLLTSQIPVRPSAIPARSVGLGTLCNTDPARTGKAAPTTAEVGATAAARRGGQRPGDGRGGRERLAGEDRRRDEEAQPGQSREGDDLELGRAAGPHAPAADPRAPEQPLGRAH